MTTTTESRAGFDPAPPSPCKVVPLGDGGGGLTLEQIAAQHQLLARPVARDPKRVDAGWGQA